jgi:hypothetical protein
MRRAPMAENAAVLFTQIVVSAISRSSLGLLRSVSAYTGQKTVRQIAKRCESQAKRPRNPAFLSSLDFQLGAGIVDSTYHVKRIAN